MPDFTLAQRLRILERDRSRCLRCGGRPVTLQHRRAKGMGGLGPRGAKLTHADGCALCLFCNQGAEAEFQEQCLQLGWKVRRNCPIDATEIPVYDFLSGSWWSLTADGDRTWVESDIARAAVRLALA